MRTTAARTRSYVWTLALLAGIMITFAACRQNNTLFVKRPSSHTGITFNNVIVENDSINPIDLEFLYNGNGVAAGDFNNDGLTDLYFTASTVSNKLYLNKGGLTFTDVTNIAKVTGEGRWANAASTVDINHDGLLDIYISNSIKTDPQQRRDLLYINQGINSDGIPVFKDMATEYGLADTSYSVHAAFFDYDNDGDLDMYLLNTKLAKREGARFSGSSHDSAKTDVDKLYRNDWNAQLGHPVFTNVSAAAGITHPGYGLGVAITDINKDGWKDIYVTNDFYGSDLMYINNHNGTFTNKLGQMFKHTSQNAMGNDVADINNDGLPDVIAVDMNPEDNFRKKKNMNASNYNIYQNMIAEGYSIQYVRNTLQLNMGSAPLENDSISEPVFSDISFFAGVAETDWSWSPSIADMDNDGFRDIIITNGYPRDVTDHDFAAFRGELGNIATREQLIDQIPQIKIRNYAFRNNGNLKFTNVTEEWGLKEVSYSNGAVYADLDNDGDLDYVINNINEEAFVYENQLKKHAGENEAHHLVIRYKGDTLNPLGLGAFAEIYYGQGGYQIHENFPYRGYLSSVEPKSFFGTGKTAVIDSVKITWPNGRVEVMQKVQADREIVAEYKNSQSRNKSLEPDVAPVFSEVTHASGIEYKHREPDYIDFNEQRLLLHKLSQYGPGLAAGDLDGNGLDDLFIGGTGMFPGKFFMQRKDGRFTMQELPARSSQNSPAPENMGVLFFDADGDNDLDVYFANGSNEFGENSPEYADQLLVNEGKGKFRWDTVALPANLHSKSCVKAADFDNDGDLDLFIGGRLKPGNYPEPVSSFIYRNDSKPGALKFTDVTNDIAPPLINIGMVCDALWTDFDNDGLTDLMLAGEWMPITLLRNNNGKFENVTSTSGVAEKIGWWNSLAAGDFDNDGDIDYLAGNLGVNSFLRVSEKYPLTLYAHDFDGNNYTDLVPTLYLRDEKGKLDEYPVHTRDDVMEQLPALKKKFLTYKEFGKANIKTIFTQKLDSAQKLQANYFESSLLLNDGKGHFTISALSTAFQLAPLYAMMVEDFNSDGWLDIAATGNDFGNEVSNGRYDALNGLVAYGNGKGSFNALPLMQSGLFIPGDGKALVKLKGINDTYMVAATQNQGPLKLFRHAAKHIPITVGKGDRFLSIHLINGTQRKEELYHGHSFLSQSSSFFFVNDAIQSVEAITSSGERRSIFQRR